MINLNALFTEDTTSLTDLFEYGIWIMAIKKAQEDIVLIDILEEEFKTGISDKYTDELKEYQKSAYGFLFDDDYRINFDDYRIKYICSDCGLDKTTRMSSFIKGDQCFCGKINKFESVDYEIVENLKEISFKELLSLFDITYINKFRSMMKKRIEVLKVKKREKRIKQRQYRESRRKNKQ